MIVACPANYKLLILLIVLGGGGGGGGRMDM